MLYIFLDRHGTEKNMDQFEEIYKYVHEEILNSILGYYKLDMLYLGYEYDMGTRTFGRIN